MFCEHVACWDKALEQKGFEDKVDHIKNVAAQILTLLKEEPVYRRVCVILNSSFTSVLEHQGAAYLTELQKYSQLYLRKHGMEHSWLDCMKQSFLTKDPYPCLGAQTAEVTEVPKGAVAVAVAVQDQDQDAHEDEDAHENAPNFYTISPPASPVTPAYLEDSDTEAEIEAQVEAPLAPSEPQAPSPLQMLRMPPFQRFKEESKDDYVNSARHYLNEVQKRFLDLDIGHLELEHYLWTLDPHDPFARARKAYDNLPYTLTNSVSFRLFCFLFPKAQEVEHFTLKDMGELELPFLLSSYFYQGKRWRTFHDNNHQAKRCCFNQ